MNLLFDETLVILGSCFIILEKVMFSGSVHKCLGKMYNLIIFQTSSLNIIILLDKR